MYNYTKLFVILNAFLSPVGIFLIRSSHWFVLDSILLQYCTNIAKIYCRYIHIHTVPHEIFEVSYSPTVTSPYYFMYHKEICVRGNNWTPRNPYGRMCVMMNIIIKPLLFKCSPSTLYPPSYVAGSSNFYSLYKAFLSRRNTLTNCMVSICSRTT